ncbi:MAG: 16S rRNA (uracil(1498)-N(3))-methyltransferase [Spirochaetaceae bacterium]|nr:16S rRNA (uracil(1498)-N(3))-methyltransferase [Spirochaetaceae bacterium]
MRQFVLPETFNGQTELKLSGDDFHYICHVIRKKTGDKFPGLDRAGNPWLISIESVEKDSCLVKLSTGKTVENENVDITLVQCLPKGKKMDQIIRQAVETGIKQIIPVLSDHAVPKFDNEKDIEKKRLRWEKIAIEAMQQSGSSIFPRIFSPIKMDDLPLIWNNCGPGLFCHQIKIDDNSLHKCLNENINQVYIVIGPEGGISPREVDLLIKAGFKSIYLGKNVLRTETAALYATAAINTVLLEKIRWNLNL